MKAIAFGIDDGLRGSAQFQVLDVDQSNPQGRELGGISQERGFFGVAVQVEPCPPLVGGFLGETVG